MSKYEPVARRYSDVPAPRPLVLIVEGSDNMSALHAIALAAGGFDVVPACDQEMAYAQAFSTRPDIIVTEVSGRPGDSWSFVQDLRRDARTRDALIVAVADADGASIRERAAREGCVALFVKPFPSDHLVFGLRALIGLNRAQSASLTH